MHLNKFMEIDDRFSEMNFENEAKKRRTIERFVDEKNEKLEDASNGAIICKT